MCEPFPPYQPVSHYCSNKNKTIKTNRQKKNLSIFLALHLQIISFLLHESITETYLSMHLRENQLATNGGLKDYITVLAIGCLIALKPTMKPFEFHRVPLFKEGESFIPLETTALFSNIKHNF